MTIYEATKNGTSIQLDRGIDGSASEVFILHTERTGSQGQSIKHSERFSTESEAMSWINHAV